MQMEVIEGAKQQPQKETEDKAIMIGTTAIHLSSFLA